MAANLDLVRAFASAAADISSPSEPGAMLQAIVDVACRSMADVDHVGVTLNRRTGGLLTDAATDPLVHELDRVQYDLGQGPCLAALHGGTHEPATVAEDLRHETRWRGFVRRAVPLGVRAVLAVRLQTGTEVVGVLNMYSTSSDTISQDTRALASLFAVQAAYAYGYTRQIGNLVVAIESRETIGNAVGIVMERYSLTRERAFEYLVRVAATSEVKLRIVAEELLRDTQARLADDDADR